MARKTIRLDGSRITNRKDMAVYMKEIFSFPETFGGNLDALHDCLSEVNADTVIQLDEETLRTICDEKYAWKVMRVLLDETEDNPHIRVKLL
jgi:RNAse (barnase) inhibitor barstar